MPPGVGERVLVKNFGKHFFGRVTDSDYLTQTCTIENEKTGESCWLPSANVVPAPRFEIGDCVRVCRLEKLIDGIITAFDETTDEYVVKDLNSQFSYANIRPLTMRLAPLATQDDKDDKDDEDVGGTRIYRPSSPVYSP